MKNNLTNILLYVVVCMLVIVVAIMGGIALNLKNNAKHTCIDMTHQICDGQCECDGLGCEIPTNNFPEGKTMQIVPIRDYQLLIVEDSLLIYDGNRHVGNILFTDDSEIGRLIYDDNH